MSEQTEHLVDRIRDRLHRAIRRMTWAEFAFGGAVAVGSVAGLWLLAALLEATLWLGATVRTGLLIAGLAILLGVVAAFLVRPIGRLLGLISNPPEEKVARTVGKHDPVVADRLVNILQLAEGRRSHAPSPYVDRAVQHLAAEIDDANFDDVADFRPARRAARWATLPVLAVLVCFLAAPSTFLGASERLLAPGTEFRRPAPFQFSVSPGDVALVKGDSLRIRARTTGQVPRSATLLLRHMDEESPRRIGLEPGSGGTFTHTVPNVRQSLRYRLVASPVRTDWYAVSVINRPLVRRLQVNIKPPSYTRRPERTLSPNVGSVTALPGSRITVSASFGGATVADARLEFENGSTQELDLEGDSASTTFVLRREGSYVLRLRSEQDVPNRDPIRYETSLQTDARPSVSFVQPTGTTDLTPDLTQQLELQLSDDYGFRRAALFYRLAGTVSNTSDSSFSSIELPLSDSRSTDQTLQHTWLLAQDSGLDVQRGDEVAYFVKVWDNDTVNGPKSGRTVTLRLRFPSLSEQYEELDKTRSETSEQMRELRRQSESVQEQFRDLRDELRRTRQADWEDRRQLERLRQKQQSVEQGVDQLSRQVEDMNRQMQRNDLSSPETTKKFEELKRTIDEIKSPELQKMMEQLRQSMREQNFPQMQRRMNRANSQLEQRQRRLERTLDLFKQLKARQKLEELSRRAQNVNEMEETIAEKTRERLDPSTAADSTSAQPDQKRPEETLPSDSSASRRGRTADARSDSSSADRPQEDRPSSQPADSSANEDLARQQEQAAEELEKLMDEMQNAEQDMKDVPTAPRKKLRKLNQEAKQQDVPEQMRKNSQQLRQNQLQRARQQQQQIQRRLQRMQSQLSSMQQQMSGQQRQMNMAGLRGALENTLRLSRKQETLRRTVEPLNEGPTVRQYAPEQKRLSDGLQHVADSLQSIASRVPRMSRAVHDRTGNALRAMEQATSSLDERRSDEATGYQKTSMMHLNELALLLSQLLDQMQQSSAGAAGMSAQQMRQQLQQTAGQQQKLNQQIQQFLNKAQGERLSLNLQQRRRQLAEQQRRIQQQLDEMNVDPDVQNQILGDLEKIAEQMGTSAEDLERGRRREDLLDRQRQILTRLLNAQQSLRTQGKKEQRQGRTAESEFERERPGDRPPKDDSDALRRDLIRALEMGYNPDYEQLIKRYFELLRQQEEPKK